MKRYGALLGVAVILFAVPPEVAAGTCALCRQALASGGNAGLVKGFYWSIILVAGVPLLIIAIVGIVAWRHMQFRRASQRFHAIGRAVNA